MTMQYKYLLLYITLCIKNIIFLFLFFFDFNFFFLLKSNCVNYKIK